MEKNIQESFVGKTSKKIPTEIVPRKLELDEQSFFSLLCDYTDSLGIMNFNKGDIVDTKSESGRERPVIIQKEVKRYFKPESGAVGSFIVSLVVSPYSYFLGRATEIPVFDLKFKVLFYPNKNEVRIGIYVNDYKADCCRKNGVSYEVIPRHFFRKFDGRFLDKGYDFFHRPEKFFELTKMGVDADTLEICKNYIKLIADFKVEPEKGVGVLDLSNESLEDAVTKVQSVFGTELFHLEENVLESFTKKISSKKNTDLISDIKYPDGVYIVHESLGIKPSEDWKWNPELNEGVIGILVVQGKHQIVVATEDSPEPLRWSEGKELVNPNNYEMYENEPKNDYNGEEYCKKLNSPEYPAAYYCLNYNKGGFKWYLPSAGELWLIYNNLFDIQKALQQSGSQAFRLSDGFRSSYSYWSSTEFSDEHAWGLNVGMGYLSYSKHKNERIKVRPVTKLNLMALKESFVKKTRKSNSKEIVQDADDKAFNPLMDAKEFVNRMEECILSYKQPYVYGKKNPYNLEKFSFEMITSWPNTFKFNRQNYHSNELLFDVSNSKKPSFRIKLIFFENINKDDHSRNIICYLTVGPIKLNKGINDDRLFQYIYDSKKKRISFVENPEGVRFDDNMESIEPTLRNLNFILNDIRFLMDNWKILYKTYLKKDSFETWNEFYKMLPSQNNKSFDFDLKESFVHKISKKTSDSLEGGEMFGEMESFGEFDMLFKRFLKKHEHQFSSCLTTDYPFKSMAGKIGYKVVLKKDCPFEDGSNDRTVLRLSLDVFQGDIMNFPEDQELNTPHGILTVAFYTELGPSTPQQINLANLEFIGGNESPVDFRFVKFKERREWEKPNFSYQLLFGLERFLMALVETMNNMDEQTWSEIGRTSANFKPFKGEACCGADSKIILDILEKHGFYSELHKNFSKVNLTDLNESFTKKVSSKKNSDLVPDLNYPDGVYFLHETLGVRTVEGWNPEDNEGVIGVLVVEGEHQIVIALEDAPEDLYWSKERKLINRPVGKLEDTEDAESDFNGEKYCRNLNSPDFPAAYYCLNYKKGGCSWHLPSAGELWLVYRHLEEIQNALSIVGGQKFVTNCRDSNVSWYWSSTEYSATGAWTLNINYNTLDGWYNKVGYSGKVRPVSNFRKNILQESFTKKVSSKKNSDLVPDVTYPNGVYIVHETLGIESYLDWKWNPDANKGVIGILVVENEHQIMVSLEDAPEVFKWSEKHKLVNRPKNSNEAESDFDGEEYRQKLNSPDFPASYYCSSYNKGGQDWYLPSLGELRLIYRNLDDIQTALEIVDGQSIVDSWGEDNPVYGSSTEFNTKRVWTLGFEDGFLYNNNDKVNGFYKVRPVSKFKPSALRESFTKKIKNKSSKDLTGNQSFQLENGLYILHETLGVQDAETWDSKYNKGVVGVLLIHNEHKFVASVDVSPKLYWSEKTGNFTAEQYRKKSYALGDYDSEKNCSVLNSPEFPAAYYCLNYNKGGRKWRLGSLGEMSLLMTRYREDFDRILEKVGAVNLKGRGKSNSNWYWTSTEYSRGKAWTFYLDGSWSNAFGTIERYKTEDAFTVIPVSTFEYNNLEESFVGKVSRKCKSDLVPDLDYPDGVYILHETLGVKTVEGWNPEDNDGVVGVLVVKDEHQLVVALEDSPENLSWSTMKYDLMNQPIISQKDAKSDFNGEEYCIYLNSPYFPAAYYCLNYNKGHRGWHLPSSGELWLIYQNFEEIQTALTIVGGKKFVTDWDENVPWYWSSTENSSVYAWFLTFTNLTLRYGNDKVNTVLKVRPVSNFKPFELKESFTKKTTTKGREENEISTSICSIG